ADLSLNVSTASRAPSILELFVDGVSPTSAALEKGDMSLDPEQTYGATVDFSARTQRLAAKVTVYGQYIDGFINNVPLVTEDGEAVVRLTIVGGFPEFNYQQVDALFAGANAAVKIVPTDWLELRTRGAMVRARDITNDGFIVFIPPDVLSQEVTLTRRKLWGMEEVRLGVSGSYTAEQTRIDLNQDFSPPPGAFFLLGASFSASIPVAGGRKLSGSVEGRNLTNQTYRSYLSRLRYFADEPGLDVVMRAKLEF
ncbi:MAG: TonB-dependent receptor, partial [Myxococcota bacterium]